MYAALLFVCYEAAFLSLCPAGQDVSVVGLHWLWGEAEVVPVLSVTRTGHLHGTDVLKSSRVSSNVGVCVPGLLGAKSPSRKLLVPLE